ncbi:hypothetical protein RI103_27490 [Paraburkholderia sp. FT54]|uniref:hypothetical protein n=1 Tax=Paraburkholderia sp. FT54 TaxID=3074437 RepID=UPI002877721E|nr:hypothetical protein [Paraburkholderia sp. FT54]WNC92030.1 hypothetical protein RI103_27490 [Paraburkholderia sp. FT54]
MTEIFAATSRASKNRLVLRRFSFLRRQAIDGYQVFLIALVRAMCAFSAPLRQSTALQQRRRGGFERRRFARQDDVRQLGPARHQPTITPFNPTFHVPGG